MNKPAWRKVLRKKRQLLSEKEVRAKSQVIAGKLLAEIDWPKIKMIHIYRSVPNWKEVDTTPVIEQVRQKFPRITIITGSTDKDASLPQEQFDLIIVPVLGFDKNNHRLGWGGGWYDRFLAAQPQAFKVGLAFQDSFIDGGIRDEAHDVRLDTVITEV